MRGAFAAWLAILCLGAVPASAHPVFLSGMIGTAPVIATVERNGADVTGWYVYARIGKQIRLAGKIDAKGAFRIEEFQSNTDQRTGVFTGTVAGARWSGQWAAAAGSKPIAFSLTEDHDPLRSLTTALQCTARTVDGEMGYVYTYSMALKVRSGTVTRLQLSRGERSVMGDEQACSIGLDDLRQGTSDSGLLLKDSAGETPEAGAGHCSIRIVAAGDYFYVAVGDTSAQNDDCRSATDTMFCSPRSFWTDLIVNRKTMVCKQVQ